MVGTQIVRAVNIAIVLVYCRGGVLLSVTERWNELWSSSIAIALIDVRLGGIVVDGLRCALVDITRRHSV